MKYFIRLSYNGAPFSGWQIQKNANSVQEELQKAFSTLLKEKIEITGAGRTDSGVNAVNYIAHTEISSIGKNPAEFLYKINAILPKEIVVKNIFKMPASAHARFDAVSRTYKYFLTLEKEPFNSAFTYFYRPGQLDFEAMNKAAKYFLGEQDFTSLEKLHSGAQNAICNVTAAGWERQAGSTAAGTRGAAAGTGGAAAETGGAAFIIPCATDIYVFTVTSNRFLRNMVRAMVGSLLEVGSGKRKPEWIAEMLARKDRCAAGYSVPGNALFLTEIRYPYPIE
ncbi:MAG: tRNA pseudouridine(38-40) synthase TruA [Bacteroidales bacterium]|jgi:tRNA pseudouridine38-40 synthase|nr:tRNA pseudouridine(38-40) synthase TruA [Bacteroidales bacterium]